MRRAAERPASMRGVALLRHAAAAGRPAPPAGREMPGPLRRRLRPRGIRRAAAAAAAAAPPPPMRRRRRGPDPSHAPPPPPP